MSDFAGKLKLREILELGYDSIVVRKSNFNENVNIDFVNGVERRVMIVETNGIYCIMK